MPIANYQTNWHYMLADCNLHELLRPQITHIPHPIAEVIPKPNIFLGDKRTQFNNHQYSVLKTDKLSGHKLPALYTVGVQMSINQAIITVQIRRHATICNDTHALLAL